MIGSRGMGMPRYALRHVRTLSLSVIVLVGSLVGAPAAAAGGLAPPDSVTAEALSPTRVRVAWNPAVGATGYRVLRATVSGGPYTLVGTTSAREYVDGGVSAGGTYHYVVASQVRNKVSANSIQATVSLPFTKPTGVRATATESTMELRWNAVPGAVRYEIVRLGNDGVEKVIGSTTATSYQDAGLPTGVRHVYWVRAVAANGATGTSDAFRVHTGPATVTTMTASPMQSEPGQRVLLRATVRFTDGRIPFGEVVFMSDAGPVGFATIDGRTGNADHVPSSAWVPEKVYAQFQGYDWTPAGASASGDVTPTAATPYGSVSFGGPSWLEVGSWEEGVATGDLTGDGLPDVVLTTTAHSDPQHDHSVFLFVQEPDDQLVLRHQYATSTPQGGSMFPLIGDSDGDGRNELLVASGDGVDVFRQGDAGLSAPTPMSFGGNVTDFRLADLDADGRADIVAMTPAGVVARYGDADAGFTVPIPVSPNWGPVLDVADISGDGRLDVVAQRDQTVQVSTQGAARAFEPPVSYPVPTGYAQTFGSLATGDVTGDGTADVVVTASGNTPGARVQVLTRDTGGAFGRWIEYPVYEIPDAVALADVNKDGRLDVVITHGGWQRAGVLLQRPDGWLGQERLTTALPPASSFSVRGLAVGDINNDGSDDLVMANYNAGLVVVPTYPTAQMGTTQQSADEVHISS